MKKHKITDYLYEGIIYKNIKAKKLQEKYSDWVSSLSRKERAAFRRYRKKITLKTNINARLRNGEITLDAHNICGIKKSPVTRQHYRIPQFSQRRDNMVEDLFIWDNYPNT